MKKFKVLVVGLGSIGRRHVRILREVAGVRISVLRERTKAPVDIPGVEEYLFDWEDLETQGFDFAVVSNPSSRHVEAAIRLVSRGIPFLLEKPVCVSTAKIGRLVESVRARRLPVLVGFNLRYHILYERIKRIVSSGRLGRPLSFLAEAGQFLPDWRAADYSETSSAKRNLGGGVIFDLTHELDLAVDLQGKVDRLCCWKDKLTTLRIETEDVAEIVLAHENRSISHIHVDYIQKKYARRFKLIMEKGEILWDYPAGTLEVTTPRKTEVIRQPAGYTRADTFRSQLKHWLEVLAGKTAPRVPLEAGVYVSQAAISAHRSAEEGRWIKLP